MFILRRITSQGITSNEVIGESYSIATKEHQPEEFERIAAKTGHDHPNIYGFVIYNHGADIMPLYQKSTYYMMTGSGVTFEKL